MHGKIRNKPFKLNPSTVLFLLLLSVSIMCMPSCSSDSDNAAVQPNYIVQATVSVEGDGPVAYALVMDGDKNLVSTLNLTINGHPMTIEYLGSDDVESTEAGDGSSIYTMDLSDLKGGDMLVFEARDQFGVIIYAPEPAVIPMAIELLEPEEGTEIVAGDEVNIRWAGGDGAEAFLVAYASLDGSALVSDDLAPGGSKTFTVPSVKTVPGKAIVGVGAITGDMEIMHSFDDDFLSQESFFIISREVGTLVEANPADVSPQLSSQYPVAKGCGTLPAKWDGDTANAACVGQFAALGIGAIVWENRRQCELSRDRFPDTEDCRNTTTNFSYCVDYGRMWTHASWATGCARCNIKEKGYWHGGGNGWTFCNEHPDSYPGPRYCCCDPSQSCDKK